ncbi:MAG: hypothetical protein HY910_07850 [Desulfarculus sp.]|nr:hypothetical protein [Desulfarculus sp.]
MDPATLIPTPEAIPLGAAWFRWLLLGTFLLHLIAMNLMLGGAVMALVHSLRPAGAGGGAPLDQEISRKLPYTIAFAVNLGVPPFLFLQVLYGQFIYASSVVMAGWWLCLFLLVMLAYYAAYVYDFKFTALGPGRAAVIGLAVILLLAAGLLLTHNMTLMLSPAAWAGHLDDPSGTLLNWSEPSLWPRFLHFVVASLAVAGLGLALWGRWRLRQGQASGQDMVARGLVWFTRATLTQLAGGLWFLFSLPGPLMQLFIGGDLGYTLALWGAVAAALLALGLAHQGRALAAGLALLPALFLMVLTRDHLRASWLQPWFSIEGLTVTPQYGPALIFGASLLVGLAMVAWMLWAARQAGKEN